MFKKIPYIAQLGNMDCGIACLTMLLNYYGCNVDIVDVGTDINIGRDGMSLTMLKDCAIKYGFNFAAYKYEYSQENISSNLPVILCSDNHYVVVEKVKKNGKYLIVDPATGREEIEFVDIKRKYRNLIVCITPGCNIKNIDKKKINIQIKIRPLILVAILMLLMQMITLFVPITVQKVIDGLSGSVYLNVYKVIGTISLIIISYFLISWIRQYILLNVNMDIFTKMISSMVHKLFRLDINFFEWHASGDIANRFSNVSQLNDIITSGLSNIVIQTITAIVCLCAMLFSSLKLTFFTIFMATLQIIIMIILNKKNLLRTKEYIMTQSKLQSDLIDILTNVVEIKCMGMEKTIGDNLLENYSNLILKFKQRTSISNLMNCFSSTLNLIFPLTIYLIGSFEIVNVNMTVGSLIAYVTLVGYFTAPFNSIVLLLPSINSVREILLRYKELMNFHENSHKGINTDGNFEIMEVNSASHSYNKSINKSLRNISIKINKGESVSIVGPSGSGKSTLIKAMLGALQLELGSIYLNGYNINEISKDQIYKWFSIVTQNPMCLNSSIRKNIDITGGFSDEEIWKALELAEISEDIHNMPLGLDTIVGEGGLNISGGQRQRLAIARALINETEVIIFDEATSNLDQITEKKIYDNLKKSNMTQIIVTHRLASVHDSDEIYVLNKGEIVESGSHDFLMKRRGWYYNSILR